MPRLRLLALAPFGLLALAFRAAAAPAVPAAPPTAPPASGSRDSTPQEHGSNAPDAPAGAARSEAASSAKPSKLEPPELITFQEAAYPPEAVAERLTADVVLQLDIDAQGRVTDARVQAPVGHGFDEAAREAALRFVFRPALRGGAPVISRILYRYSFTLTEAAAEPAAATPAAASLTGVVRMAGEGAPLPSARVVLRLNDGRTLATTADESGQWSFAQIPPGHVTVHVEAEGFLPWDGTESLGDGEKIEVAYSLRAPGTALEVTVRGERPDREITKRTLERKELGLIPGTSGDALRAIETMPGVARSPAMAGMVIVRGSGPHGTQMFVDGTYVPNLYHFNGLTSVIPTEMIEGIDFYPGNFSAKYGRVNGGIIDVRLREMDRDGKYHGFAQVDLIDARLLLRGPVPLLDGWNFEIAARRSHIDTWLGPLLEGSAGVRTAPVYYDWQGFVETKPTPRSTFRLGVFGSDDRLSLVFKDPSTADPGLGNSYSTGTRLFRFQALYRNQVSDRLSLSAVAAVGSDADDLTFGSMYIHGNYVPLTFRGDVSYKLSNQFTVRAGPDIQYYYVKGDLRTPQPPDPGQPEPGPYSTQPYLSYRSTDTLSGPAGFAEVEWQPNESAKVLVGTRLDYFNKTDRLDVAPRLNARYDLHHAFPRTTVKAGAGLFYEPPEPLHVVDVYGSKGLRSNRSTHYALGFEQEFTRDVELSVEGFYKNLSDLVMRVPSADGTLGYQNVGDGKVLGVETLLKWKPSGRFFGWLAYTLSRSTRHNGPQEPERLFEYDQTHILSVLGSYDLGRGWQLGARFRYVSGSPHTACVAGVLDAGSGVYSCKSGPLLGARMPSFNQLDVRVDKTWKFTDWKLTYYLDVQNAYNRSNTEAVMYNYNYTKPEYQSGLPVVPSMGLRGEF